MDPFDAIYRKSIFPLPGDKFFFSGNRRKKSPGRVPRQHTDVGQYRPGSLNLSRFIHPWTYLSDYGGFQKLSFNPVFCRGFPLRVGVGFPLTLFPLPSRLGLPRLRFDTPYRFLVEGSSDYRVFKKL